MAASRTVVPARARVWVWVWVWVWAWVWVWVWVCVWVWVWVWVCVWEWVRSRGARMTKTICFDTKSLHLFLFCLLYSSKGELKRVSGTG